MLVIVREDRSRLKGEDINLTLEHSQEQERHAKVTLEKNSDWGHVQKMRETL